METRKYYYLLFLIISIPCLGQIPSVNIKNLDGGIINTSNFDNDKKLLLIETLWEIVLSDGELHDFESNIIRRLAGLLYISDVNSGNARKRALNKNSK